MGLDGNFIGKVIFPGDLKCENVNDALRASGATLVHSQPLGMVMMGPENEM